MFRSLLLGIVQGFTEFLPVSSSGHLALFQQFMDMGGKTLTFDIILHSATMLATLIYFREEILGALKGWTYGFVSASSRAQPEWILGWSVITGNIFTVIIALFLKPWVEIWIFSTPAVASALLVTSAVLFYASVIPAGSGKLSLPTGMIIGIAQGFAVIPGLSRSGITIVTAIRMGLSPEKAFSFSFLLSIPAILGANLLEAFSIARSGAGLQDLPDGWFMGTVAAFLSGYAALIILKKVVVRGRWRGFAFYCLAVGSMLLLINFIGGIH
ncbi:MAG TPA: undecaprenyl-diphosphate phosphatase [Synergistales bacterium]|nr:undecaprenyl-diphosphate phosphatase [Synergistales bacterium]